MIRRNLVLIMLVVLMSWGLVGCGSDLTEPQEVTVQFVNAFFAKSDNGKPTLEERYKTINSVVSITEKGTAIPEQRSDLMRILREADKKGLTGVYFIAENPAEPQSKSFSSQLVKLPKSSFPGAKGENNSVTLEVTLQLKNGDWKIADLREHKSSEKVEWQEVKPFD